MIVGTERTSVQQIAGPKPSSPSTPQEQAPAAATVEPIRFINPSVTLDSSGLVVVQIRDTETGEIELQIPNEKAVEAYRKRAAEDDKPEAPKAEAQPAQQPAEAVQPVAPVTEPAVVSTEDPVNVVA